MQLIGEQFDQCLIRGGIHRRSGYLDPQFISQGIANFIRGGARLEFHREKNVAALNAEVSWNVHYCSGQIK